MSCEFDYYDCKNEGIRCDLCFNALHYVAKPVKSQGLKKKNNAKITKRMGAQFEMNNHKAVSNNINSVVTDMTPNSGAGKIKGGTYHPLFCEEQ